MMTSITRLPNRPLQGQDFAALAETDLQVVPYGGIPAADSVEIYAVKIAAEGIAYALGFEADSEQWRHLASVDAGDLAAADEELDGALDDWIATQYGNEFEITRTV